jgi:hypothetical protein
MGASGAGNMKRPDVQYAEPIDYAALMRSASQAATEQVNAQYRAMIRNYPKLEALSLGTVDKIAGNLRTPETAEALAAIRQGMSLYAPEDRDPTSIERRLYDDAERDLALGRSLSAEDERMSQQSARGAFAARGLGTSLGSAAAEVLGRQSMADQREAERRNFASAANNMLTQNVGARRQAIANLNFTGAGNLMAADPYARALGPGLNYSGGTLGNQMQQMTSAFGNATGMAGNVASFNMNAIDSRANSAMNNWAAMRGAQMGAGASQQAGMMGMYGGIGGGLLTGAGMAI